MRLGREKARAVSGSRCLRGACRPPPTVTPPSHHPCLRPVCIGFLCPSTVRPTPRSCSGMPLAGWIVALPNVVTRYPQSYPRTLPFPCITASNSIHEHCHIADNIAVHTVYTLGMPTGSKLVKPNIQQLPSLRLSDMSFQHR